VITLARYCFHHRRIVVSVWAFILLALTIGSGVAGSHYQFSTDFPGSESKSAYTILAKNFPTSKGDSINIAFQGKNGYLITSPNVSSQINIMLDKVSKLPHVASIVSPYSTQGIGQISYHVNIAFATVNLDDSSFAIGSPTILKIANTINSYSNKDVVIATGGSAVSHATPPKIGSSEIIGFLAAAIILLLAFGSLLSMILPLLSAMLALGAALATIAFLTHFISIPNFAPQLAALIGIGVGIDYALFVITRHRTNLRKGMAIEESVYKSFDTAGRAVVFAAITVMIAMSGLGVTGIGFLYGLALAAVMGVVWTLIVTLTFLPAMLGFVGDKVLSRRERRILKEEGPAPEVPSGGWMHWAMRVQKNPLPFTVVAFSMIIILAVPVFSLRLGNSDAGNDPAGTTSRINYDILASGFGPGFNGPLLVVAETTPTNPLIGKSIEAAKLLKGVVAVSPAIRAPNGKAVFYTIYPAASPQSAETSNLIKELRTKVYPQYNQGKNPLRFYIGGSTASGDDFANILQKRLPYFLLVAIGLSCLLLMLAFRSILIPLKAAVMNLIAASAAFGILVGVFQKGWGAHFIGVDRTGPIDAFLPIMLLAILFGLSMDYQVFLVSRIHEEWILTGDNKKAVTRGLGETGRVITAAALIMVSVFFSFIFGGDRVIKMFGVGLAVAIFLDAFLIRSVLVPSLMMLFGKWNWWLPKWLDKVLPHLTIEPIDFGKDELIIEVDVYSSIKG
jgi:RND superfamily putative drug exporter